MRYIGSWLLYLMGSLFGSLTHLLNAEWPHRVFSWFMWRSNAVQGKGAGPWMERQS